MNQFELHFSYQLVIKKLLTPFIVFLLFINPFFLLSCTKKIDVPQEYEKNNQDFQMSDVFKNNINYTIEISLNQSVKLLEELAIKLYNRNPNQIRKEFDYGVQDVVDLIANNKVHNNKGKMLSQLGNYRAEELLKLAFHPRYKNDRVLAFVYGLRTMLNDGYGNEDFFMFDQVEPQKIHNLARNFEIAFWQLFNAKNSKNEPYIYSINLDEKSLNLSYERMAGKIIQLQDLLSEITSKAYGKNLTRQWIDFSKAFYFII